MKVTLTTNQTALMNALSAAEIKTECDTNSVFQLDDWLRVLAYQYGADELRAGIGELIQKLEEENAG